MLFGLCNDPFTYQRVIDTVLKNASHSLPYIDDTLTFSTSFKDNLEHLREVRDFYRDANRQLRMDKCYFGYNEVEFLGLTLSNLGYRPLSSSICRIQHQARPSSVKHIRSFLGLVNYYRDFQPLLSEIAAPIYNLTRMTVAWKWGSSV